MANNDQWHPFRPTEADLERIADDLADIPEIQTKTSQTNPEMRSPDRVAHEYQIAGSKVIFNVADKLPEPLRGVGLFQLGAQHLGIGRISTGLGIPHAEFLPDFLGIMTAFQTKDRVRVDFLGINDQAAPTDNHQDFIAAQDLDEQLVAGLGRLLRILSRIDGGACLKVDAVDLPGSVRGKRAGRDDVVLPDHDRPILLPAAKWPLGKRGIESATAKPPSPPLM